MTDLAATEQKAPPRRGSDPARTNSLPQPASPAKSSFYRPELDALRWFAFLSVFLLHIGGPSWWTRVVGTAGAFGVCLFFFLSSYLITELLLRERAITGTVHLRQFYLRRILRIWPLYFAFLALCWLFGRVPGQPSLESGRVLAFLLLAGNWYTSRFGFTLNPINPLWSISVEEQFYLFVPLMAKLGGRRGLSVTAVILVLNAYLVIYAAHRWAIGGMLWTNSFVHFQYFALGILTAIFLRGRIPGLPWAVRIPVAIAGVAMWIGAVHAPHFLPAFAGDALYYALAGVGALLIFFAFLGVNAASVPRSLIYLGKISYGLYVFHLFALETVRLLAAFATAKLHQHTSLSPVLLGHMERSTVSVLGLLFTIALAALSYQYLEKPFLLLKRRLEFVQTRKA